MTEMLRLCARLCAVLELAILSLAPVALAQESGELPPWESQTMYWGWSPYNNSITQCRPLTIQWWQIHGTSPPIQAPFTFTFYLEGYEPYNLNLGDGFVAGKVLNYNWTVDLPTGGPYQMSLTDANGATGGVGSYLYVNAESPAVSGCTLVNLVPSALNFTVIGDTNQCATLGISVVGGTPPYTLTVVEQYIQTKVVTYASGYFDYVLDIGSGKNVLFSVTDSKGLGAVGSEFNVGASANTDCLTAAQTLQPLDPALTTIYPGTTRPTATGSASQSTGTGSKKTSAGAIAGIAVGALLLLTIAGCFGALWQRRKVRRLRPGDLDLGDESGAPAGSPVDPTHVAATAAPYRYSSASSSNPGQRNSVRTEGFAPSEAGLAALIALDKPAGNVSHYQPRGSAYYDAFPPIGASPPYTPYDTNPNTATSSSYNPNSSQRDSKGGGSEDTSRLGLISHSRRSSDQDLSTRMMMNSQDQVDAQTQSGSRLVNASPSPGLPPGAARPISPARPLSSAPGDEEALNQIRTLAWSPPPTYPSPVPR